MVHWLPVLCLSNRQTWAVMYWSTVPWGMLAWFTDCLCCVCLTDRPGRSCTDLLYHEGRVVTTQDTGWSWRSHCWGWGLQPGRDGHVHLMWHSSCNFLVTGRFWIQVIQDCTGGGGGRAEEMWLWLKTLSTLKTTKASYWHFYRQKSKETPERTEVLPLRGCSTVWCVSLCAAEPVEEARHHDERHQAWTVLGRHRLPRTGLHLCLWWHSGCVTGRGGDGTGSLHKGKVALTQALCWHVYKTRPVHKGKVSLTQASCRHGYRTGLCLKVRFL